MKRLSLAALLCFAGSEIYFVISALTIGGGEFSRMVLVPVVGVMMTTGGIVSYLLGALLLRSWPRLGPTQAFVVSGGAVGLVIFLLFIWWHLSLDPTVPMLSLLLYVLASTCWGAFYTGCALLARHLAPLPTDKAAAMLKPALRGS